MLRLTSSSYTLKHPQITDPLLDSFGGIKSTASIIKYSVVKWNTIAAETEKFGYHQKRKQKMLADIPYKLVKKQQSIQISQI